jgi:hypothetical protein
VTTGAGITRLLQVLYRINFLTIVLCLCMNRPYQFYYFPPLVSFWYLGQGSLSPLNIAYNFLSTAVFTAKCSNSALIPR